MDHRTNENYLVSEQVLFDQSWNLEATITECPLWFLDMVLAYVAEQNNVIMKKIEGDAIFSRSFWNFERSQYNFLVSYCSWKIAL